MKKTRRRAPFAWLFTALCLLPSLPAWPQGSGKAIIGYFPAWAVYSSRNYFVTDIDASKLTHVNYAFAKIDSLTGTCVLGDSYADVDKFFAGDCWSAGCLRGNIHQFELLKQANPHLKVMVSVGGWNDSQYFSDVALTAASRQTFVASCVSLFLKGEYGGTWGTHPDIIDGFDIDWEYPVHGGLVAGRPEDTQNYTLLMQEFRLQLDALGALTGRTYLLSIGTGAAVPRIDDLDLPGLSQAVDYVNVMTYDFHGTWNLVTNFNAPLYFSSTDPGSDPDGLTVDGAVTNYLAAGCPAAKLVMGIPFYGRSWTGVTNANDGLYQPATGEGPGTRDPGTLDFWDVAQNYEPTYAKFTHPEAQVPWLFDGTNFITYDDTATVDRKAKYICDHDLAGAMLWELSQDVRGVPAPAGSLLDTLFASLDCSALPPGRIPDLTLSRAGGDILFTWTLDPGALGGYHLYQGDVKQECSLMRDAHPAYDPFATIAPPPVLPFVYTGGIAQGLLYYQVLGVASDGITEGPN